MPTTHIGCGIGLQTLLLAEATGGCVTGLDISAELLAYAQSKIKASPLAELISFPILATLGNDYKAFLIVNVTKWMWLM